MPHVTFYHGVHDKLLTSCRVIQDLFHAGRRVLVYAPDPRLAEHMDQRLWTFASLSFVPHCRDGAPRMNDSPVLIAPHTHIAGFDDALLNLSYELPPDFQRFQEIIEVVAQQEDDAVPARMRFKQYKEQGCPIAAQNYTPTAPEQRFARPAASRSSAASPRATDQD